jgi:hypothetical protein
VALAVLIVACGGGPVATTPPDSLTQQSTTTTAPPVSETEVFAWVLTVDDASINYDPVEVLTGEEAVARAHAEGAIGPNETLDTDFYISNPQMEEVASSLDPNGTYRLLGFGTYGDIVETSVTLSEFAAVLNGANSKQYYGIVPGMTLAQLTLDGDVVTRALQVYLP